MTLHADSLSKAFGRIQALDDVTFTAERGKILGLIGPNGSGKSTTFRIILDLLNADQGKVSWDGKPIAHFPKEKIGFLPEERGLYPKLPVVKQLRYFGALKGRSRSWIDPEIDEWLAHYELTDRAKDKPETLSKGNQQKVQLIMSFIHQPELLILDEPFSGLDPVNAEFLMQSVLKLRDMGSTIIFSSHRMDHVEDICDHICLLKEGHMLFSGGILELKNEEGRRKLRLDPRLSEERIHSLPGVTHARLSREHWTVYLDDEARAREIYPLITDADGFTDKFSLDYYTLEEIFKRRVGADHRHNAQTKGVQ